MSTDIENWTTQAAPDVAIEPLVVDAFQHVAIPDLKQPIILYRHKDGLAVRCPGHLTIDGHSVKERGPLSETSRVLGEDFAFALEPVGSKLGKV